MNDRRWSLREFSSTAQEAAATQRRKRGRALAMLIGIGLVLVVIAGGALVWASASSEPPPVESGFFTDQVVVVGAPGRGEITTTDAQAIDSSATRSQVGALLPVAGAGACPLSSWATLSAGQDAVINSCQASIGQRKVENFDALNAEAAGVLGALAREQTGCITPIGQGAALAAANQLGELEAYADPTQWIANGMPTSCALTLVDAGSDSDRVIGELRRRTELTVIVFGLPDSAEAAREPQAIYRIGTTLPGVMTGERVGQVGLPELSGALGSRPLRVSEREQVRATDARAVLREARGGVPPLVWTIPLIIIAVLAVVLGLRSRSANRRNI